MEPDPRCEGELRASKGALIFVPEGADHFLRVEVDAPLPEGFLSGAVRTTLCQEATEVLEADEASLGVFPEHGVPEELSGTVIGRDGRRVAVDLGAFKMVLLVPEGTDSPARIYAKLAPPLSAEGTLLL